MFAQLLFNMSEKENKHFNNQEKITCQEQINNPYNYRRIKQSREAKQLAQNQELMSIINDSNVNKYKELKGRFDSCVFQNFIEYNEATCHLICKINHQIYQHSRLHGIATTFLTTAKGLTDYSKALGIKRNVKATEYRLKVLQDEGVIKRLDTPDKIGSYYIITADLTKPFQRPRKGDFEIKNTTTTPSEQDMSKIEAKEAIYYNSLEKEQKSIDEQLKEQRIAEAKARFNKFCEDNEQEQKDQEKQWEEEKKHIWDEVVEVPLVNEEKVNELLATEIPEDEDIDIKDGDFDFKVLDDFLIQPKKDEEELKEAMEIIETFKLRDEQNTNELKHMFTEFIGERTNGKGVKIKAKEARGIKLTINELKKINDKGINVFDALTIALAKSWQGIKVEWIENEMGLNKKVKLKFNNYYNNALGGLLQQINLDTIMTMNKIATGEIKTQDELHSALTTSQSGVAQQLQVMSNKVNRAEGEKRAQEMINQQEAKENDKISRVVNACKEYKNTQPIKQSLLLNITDKAQGENCYRYLIKHFSKKVGNKYPNDIKRQIEFEQSSLSILNRIEERYQYFPLLLAYKLFKELPEDWVDRTSDIDIFDCFFNDKRYNDFWIKDIFNSILDDEYVVGQGWVQVLKQYNLEGIEGAPEEFNNWIKIIPFKDGKVESRIKATKYLLNCKVKKEDNTIYIDNDITADETIQQLLQHFNKYCNKRNIEVKLNGESL